MDHQIQRKDHPDLDESCPAPPANFAGTNLTKEALYYSSDKILVSPSPISTALPNFSSAPLNVSNSIPFQQVADNSGCAARPFPQNILGESSATTATHLGDRLNSLLRTCSIPKFTDSFTFTDADRRADVEGSTSSSTHPSPSLSGSADSSTIQCTWPSCDKKFRTRSEYNHHSKNHTRPFQCTSCLARHATKRQLDRHINEKHDPTENYYCIVSTCKRSLAQEGKPFRRDDGCRKHMKRVHRMTDEQVKECGMDEGTRLIRLGRKIGRKTGS